MKLPHKSTGHPAILPRADYGITQSGVLPWDPVAYCLITAFTTLSLWMVIEIHIQIWAIFKRRQGLYFWSLLATAWGVVGHTVGFLLKWFAPNCHFVVWGIIVQLGWWAMISGFSLVLYSRLHLVVRNRRIQQGVLIMIAAVYFGIQWPTTIIFFGFVSPKYSKKWKHADQAMEKVQVVVVSLAESIIEAIYIWATLRLLKPGFNVKPRKVLISLITISSLNMLSNIMLITVDYCNLYVLKAAIHGWVYTIKLRLEFVVLNQLMAIASKGLAPSGTAASPAKSGQSDPNQGSFPTSYTVSQPDLGLGLSQETSPEAEKSRRSVGAREERHPGEPDKSWFHSFAESEKEPGISQQDMEAMPSTRGRRNDSVTTGSTVVPPVPSLRGMGSMDHLNPHPESRPNLGDVARARRALEDKMKNGAGPHECSGVPIRTASKSTGDAPHVRRGLSDKSLPETPPAIQDVLDLPHALETGDPSQPQISPSDSVDRPQPQEPPNFSKPSTPHQENSAPRPPSQSAVPPTAVLPPEILAGPPQSTTTQTPSHHLWPRRMSSRKALSPSHGPSSSTHEPQSSKAGFGATPSATIDAERALAFGDDDIPGLFAAGERRASVEYIGERGLGEVADDDDMVGLQRTEFFR